jgi:hypothetical protein
MPAVDTDGDGCTDVQELGPDPVKGGDRDPLYFWDFYDVTHDRTIDLSDTIAILQSFGTAPGAPLYNALLDRYAPDAAKPWRTAAATALNIGIDVSDAVINLRSFGHHCG